MLSVGVSAGFSSCESCGSLSPQTFGPRPASLRMAVAQGGRHNLRGQLEVIAEILDALIGEVPAEVSPGKLFLHVASQFERQHGFRDVKIRHVLVSQLWVLGHVDILLGHHHPLLKKEFINGNPVLLGHQHLQEERNKQEYF